MPRITATGLDGALDAVRARYPTAWQEGSTGYSRTYFIRSGGDAVLVARATPKRFRGDPWTEIPFNIAFEGPETLPETVATMDAPGV